MHFRLHATQSGMSNAIDAIDEKRRRLADLDKDRLVELLAGFWATVEDLLNDATVDDQVRTKSKGKKNADIKLTKAWAAILLRLCSYEHFRASDVILISREFHSDGKIDRIQTPGGARAQLCQLTKKRIIKRLGGGNYRVTEKTRATLKQSRR